MDEAGVGPLKASGWIPEVSIEYAFVLYLNLYKQHSVTVSNVNVRTKQFNDLG